MTAEKDILSLLTGLKDERRELVETIQPRINSLDRDIASVSHVLELLRQKKGVQWNGQIKASDLVDLSQMKALIEIAKANDGILVVSDARRLFIEAGLSKSKFISQGIYSRMNRSELFEHLAPGRFRLVNTSEKS